MPVRVCWDATRLLRKEVGIRHVGVEDGTIGLPHTFHIIMPSGDAYTVFFGLRPYFSALSVYRSCVDSPRGL